MQMEGRALGPSGTHFADSLNDKYLAFCSHSLLEKNKSKDTEARILHERNIRNYVEELTA